MLVNVAEAAAANIKFLPVRCCYGRVLAVLQSFQYVSPAGR